MLADPEAETGLPRSFVGLDFSATCAWWETLRYLFRGLLGWHCIPAGLAWWYEKGRPDLGDPRLRLALERWNTCGELDWFAAREWESRGQSILGLGDEPWEVAGYEPGPGWWTEFKSRRPFAPHPPYGGGTNPLHLGHSDAVGEARGRVARTGTHDVGTRQAVVVVGGFASWRRELRAFGGGLPDIGDRSWRVDVFDRRVGWLGTYRRSRVTGHWFQGRHSIHAAGNAASGVEAAGAGN